MQMTHMNETITSKKKRQPEPEVDARPTRRIFSAKYKLEILKEADACEVQGEIGSLLRREGLYSSHLTDWRKQRDVGALQELGRKRGPKGKLRDREKERLQRECVLLRREVEQLRAINEIQKKVSNLLGIPLATPDAPGEA